MRLQNKVAVLTGGGSGIGRATALRFAEEGARVVVDDLNQAWADETVSLVAKQGGEAVAVIADVTERAGVRKMFGTAQERFGGYDILVNNAGVLSHASILDLEEEEWDRVMRVNLRSMYLCTQEAARYWVQNGRPGKIINLGSVTSEMGATGLAHYVTSKGGGRQFTRACALELAPHKINVNAVGPGTINTNIAGGGGEPSGPQSDVMGRIVPLGRGGQPVDVANNIIFLASEEADYITGVLLIMDGGRSIAMSSVRDG